MRGKYHLLTIPALLVYLVIVAFARDSSWLYLTMAALFMLLMADALRAEVPAAVHFRDPGTCVKIAHAGADLVLMRALSLAMEAMPARHMRTPGALYGAELVPLLTPVFMLCGMLVWLWWVFRTVQPALNKGALLITLLLRSAMAGFSFSAAFLGADVRPACALGGLLLLVSSSISAAYESADHHTQEGLSEALVWSTHLAGVVLLTVGISLLH